MISIPENHEDKLDIIWAAIRSNNQEWMAISDKHIGVTMWSLVNITGWSYSTVERAVKELVKLGQVERKWNHQHQSFWTAHYRTLDEHPVTFTGHEYDHIPF